jgi:hypothetical protein
VTDLDPKHRRQPIVQYAAEDVTFVLKEARFVIRFNTNSSSWDFLENDSGRLNVIAAIGPGIGLPSTPVAGQQFEECLLLEVGIGRTRPYHAGRNFDGPERRRLWVKKRRKWFTLTDEQYQNVAPFVFTTIQYLTNKRVKGWESPTFWLKGRRTYYSRANKRTFVSETYREQERGARFSVSPLDEQLTADIYAAQLRNPAVLRQIRGLRNYVELWLDRHRTGYVKKFDTLKASSEIYTAVRQSLLPVYLRQHALKQLRKPFKVMFTPVLSEYLGLDLRSDIPQVNMAKTALPNPHNRVNGTRLLVHKEGTKFHTIEVFADLETQSGKAS